MSRYPSSPLGGSLSSQQRDGSSSNDVTLSNAPSAVPAVASALPPAQAVYEDCLGCRLVGVGTLGGMAAYNAYLFSITPKSARGSRLFYLGFGGAAAALAVYRAVM